MATISTRPQRADCLIYVEIPRKLPEGGFERFKLAVCDDVITRAHLNDDGDGDEAIVVLSIDPTAADDHARWEAAFGKIDRLTHLLVDIEQAA